LVAAGDVAALKTAIKSVLSKRIPEPLVPA